MQASLFSSSSSPASLSSATFTTSSSSSFKSGGLVTLDTEPPVSELLVVTYNVHPSDRPKAGDRLYLHSRLGVLTSTGHQSSRINHLEDRKKENTIQLLFLGKTLPFVICGDFVPGLANDFLRLKID